MKRVSGADVSLYSRPNGNGNKFGRRSETSRLGCGLGCICASDRRALAADLELTASSGSCTAIPSGGFGAFGGLITKGFGFDSFQSVLMQMPVGAIGIICLLSSIWVTNKIKLRYPVLA